MKRKPIVIIEIFDAPEKSGGRSAEFWAKTSFGSWCGCKHRSAQEALRHLAEQYMAGGLRRWVEPIEEPELVTPIPA